MGHHFIGHGDGLGRLAVIRHQFQNVVKLSGVSTGVEEYGYGGSSPASPYIVNNEGKGVAWANSLFEDNAEFGLGVRLAIDNHKERASVLLKNRQDQLKDSKLVEEILTTD